MSRAGGTQRGVALAMVVWFIAGMSLLVAGIVSHARVDTRMTQLHLARATTVAAGDGAILLALAERQREARGSADGPLIVESRHRLGDTEVTVRLLPANGLIDLNSAPREVLSALFSHVGGLAVGDAQSLADTVVKWRQPGGTGRDARLKRRTFPAPEDLLRVEGVTRSLLDAIGDYVVAGEWAQGTMNWSASPGELLGVLEALDPARAQSVLGRRDNLGRTTGGDRGQTGTGRTIDTAVLRADALVSQGGSTWLRRRWLVRGGAVGSALPWKVVRTEQPRVVKG